MFKYHNISYSRQKFVVRNVVSAVQNQNCFSCYNSENYQWYRMGNIVIFKLLARIPNVAVLVRPMVNVQYGCKHVLICCAFKTRPRDESLRYVSEPVVMYCITPSIVMQKRKILNCKKKIIFNLEKNLKNASKNRCNYVIK